MSSQLPINLPPRLVGGNKQVITAAWGNAIREAIARLADRKWKEGKGGAVSSQYGAFWTRYSDELGDTYLQGGTITGGNGGSESIADEKVMDAETGAETNADKILYIQANCTATVEDGIMLPGCLLNSASLSTVAIGTGVPANHTFTVASATGNIYLEIGRWNADSFLPAGPPGNLLASGCIGDFSISKVT